MRANLGKGFGDGCADAGTGAGDEGDFIGESEHGSVMRIKWNFSEEGMGMQLKQEKRSHCERVAELQKEVRKS